MEHSQSIHCDQCDLSFNTNSTLSFHKNTFHTDKLLYKCDECTYTSKEKQGLKRHIESHHNGVTHACETCGKFYSSAKSLGRHRRIAHEGLIFSCQYCSYKAKKKYVVSQHQAFTHFNGGNVACQLCDEKFQKPKLLEVHMQTHKAFTCSQCATKFRHQWHLTKHEKMHVESGFNNTPENPYLCTECEKSFSNLPGLKQHSVVHSDVRAFSCGCGKSFKRSPELKNHKCNLKTDSGEIKCKKSYKCNQCDYTSSRAGDLDKHLKTHDAEKLNKCNQCDYACFWAHLKAHNREKSNKCNQCDFTSSYASALTQHLKTHSGENLNKCNHVTLHPYRQAI